MTQHSARETVGVPFLIGMALLVLAVVACVAGVWTLVATVLFPEPTNLTRARETAQLVQMIHDANQMVDAGGALSDRLPNQSPKLDNQQSNRVREVLQGIVNQRREDDRWQRLDTDAAVTKLVERQDADLLNWWLSRLFLLIVPSLVVGGVAGWLGLRTLRRLQVPGTVFAAAGTTGKPRQSEKEEETDCLECGKRIPAGAASCPGCGWSYMK